MRDRRKLSFPLPLARSRETRLARPNRRACSQANGMKFLVLLAGLIATMLILERFSCAFVRLLI